MLVTLRKWNDRCKMSWAIQEKYDLSNSDCFLFDETILASFKYDQLAHIWVKDFSLQQLGFNKIRREEGSFCLCVIFTLKHLILLRMTWW